MPCSSYVCGQTRADSLPERNPGIHPAGTRGEHPRRQEETGVTVAHPTLSVGQEMTLEAFADTVLPGRKRSPADHAVAGVDDSPGAVEAGALAVLTDPATGIAEGVGAMADELNRIAADMVREDEQTEDPLPPFVRLPYRQRRELVAELTSTACEQRELWFLVAMFAYMAFDSAPHLDTVEAMRSGHPGLLHLGFRPPDEDGLWRASRPTYGRPMAPPRAGTDEFGNLP